MIYRSFDRTNAKTSLLGMGCMRLPTVGDPGAPVDFDRAEPIIDYAYSHGVNYFDTAYVYHGGDSERFIGRALKKYPRDTWYLATKMPSHPIKSHDDVVRIFNEQLERCQVDYFDFYLCHGVVENNMAVFTNEEYGVIPFLEEKLAEGKIRRLGFSSHCEPEGLRKFASLRKWDFAQIQLNYFDWTYQDAKQQYEILEELGIPVVVMEPCRGGRLSDLDEDSNRILTDCAPDRSVSSWAFRWLQSLPNLQVVLSGMSNMEQVQENVATFEQYDTLSETELDALMRAKESFSNKFTIPCTGCRYCSECPQSLDIPEIISSYNDLCIASNDFSRGGAVRHLLKDEKTDPNNCIGCGSCTEHCPQKIDTPAVMKDLVERMGRIPEEFMKQR